MCLVLHCFDPGKEEIASDSSDAEEHRVVVQPVQRRSDKKRMWDKRHYCAYCNKPQSKIARHLERIHGDELDVAAALCHKKGSNQRNELLMRVRKRGDYLHNYDVMEKNKGMLVTCRRPVSATSGGDYDMCEFCFGFFARNSMWKHRKNCAQFRHAKATGIAKNRRAHSAANLTLLPVSNGASAALKSNVLPHLNNDRISFVLKQDELIMTFGSHLYKKHGSKQTVYIKQRLRELGRLLITVRDSNEDIRALSDCIAPQYFGVVVAGVKILCGYDEEQHAYKVPSLALKIGHSLKAVANILKGNGLKTGNSDLQKLAKDFRDLCELEWHTEVSGAALDTLQVRKYNKIDMLPLAADVKRMFEYMEDTINQIMAAIQAKFSSQLWSQLCRLVLAYLVIFNRRRGGELERLPLANYEARSKGAVSPDYTCGLSDFEKKLCATLERVEMRGKKGRKVAVLFTEFATNAVDVLIKLRLQAGVDENNPYLFARCNSSSLDPQRSSECIRFVAEQAQVANRESVTSTKLRKQVATQLQLLALKDNEMDVVADFLGHDIRVHRQFYRLPEGTLQLAKVSKIFMALERGDLQKFHGKSLDEIEPGAAGISSSN